MDKLNYIIHFLKHRLGANSLNSIHSPFVFELAEKIIKSDEAYYAFVWVENERKKLLNNPNSITIEDFGAGSKVFKSNTRKVEDIAKTSLKSPKEAQLLFKILHHLGYKNVLELGTSLGITSAYMASISRQMTINTIEGDPSIASIAKQVHSNLGLNNITVHLGEFSTVLPQVIKQNTPFDCIFIDGNHTEKATLDYFNLLLPHVHNNSMMVFDDIYWSKGMTKAWEVIKQHKDVQVSIDLFNFGLIFFRQEQPKQHFNITF